MRNILIKIVNNIVRGIEEFISELGFIGVFSVLIIMGVCALITVSVYHEISFGNKYGKIVNKEYYPSYVTHNKYGMDYHGEKYQFQIEKDGKRLWISVSEGEYNNMKIGDCYNKC